MQAARAYALAGRLGEVHEMEVHVSVFMPWDLWSFMAGIPRLEILYHSIHYIDLCRAWFGNPTKVLAKTTRNPLSPKLAATRSVIVLEYDDWKRVSISTNHTHTYPETQRSQVTWEGTEGALEAIMGVNLDYPVGTPDRLRFASRSGDHAGEWTIVPTEGNWFPDAFIGSMARCKPSSPARQTNSPTAFATASTPCAPSRPPIFPANSTASRSRRFNDKYRRYNRSRIQARWSAGTHHRGASGIGEATSKELVRAGAFVWIADINFDAATKLATELGKAQALSMNVTSTESIDAAATQLKSLDILVNNAGIGHVGSVETTKLEDFDRLLDVNVRSVFLVTQRLLPLLLASANKGSIVNIGSVAGMIGIKQRFAYCTTKGAVLAMTRQLAVEYAKELRVNAICPGTVETPFVEGYLDKYHAHEKEKIREELRARQPMGRLGQPEEVASMVRYLSSREAGFISGSLFTLDGGWTAA